MRKSDPPKTALTAVEALRIAAREAGLEVGDFAWQSGQAVYQLSEAHARVVRLTEDASSSQKEVQYSRWLMAHGVNVIEPLPIEQPLRVDEWIITFWRGQLPLRRGTPHEVAQVLRKLHQVPPPTAPSIPPLGPFEKLKERIALATTISDDDRSWLGEQLGTLRAAWNAGLPDGLPSGVIHGDPWMGSIGVGEDGTPRLLQVTRCSLGRPEWDLTSNAIKFTSTHGISREQYREFSRIYGFDVVAWSGYSLLRDIREFRMATHLAQVAGSDVRQLEEAQLRIDCIRGRRGPRPWPWTDYVP